MAGTKSRLHAAPALWAAAALLFGACDKDDEIVWVQFNQDQDKIEVQVTAADAVGEDVALELFSNTGAVKVGDASISPGSGPVGTEHLLRVSLIDDYEARVGRVTVQLSGERGEEEEEMRQDSADLGEWDLTVISLGAPGEERTDTFTFRLWEDEAAPAASTTSDTGN